MTSDRLREAADRLDGTQEPLSTEPYWHVSDDLGERAAALLRLVADRPHDFGMGLQAWLIALDAATANVADAVLGRQR